MLQSFQTIQPKNRTPKIFWLLILAIVGFLISLIITNCEALLLFIGWKSFLLLVVETPNFSHNYQLFLPTVIFACLALAITNISPSPKTWSRSIVIAVLMSLLIRYLLWRCLVTLNLASPLHTCLSLGLLLLELTLIFRQTLAQVLMLRLSDQSKKSKLYAEAVKGGLYCPAVDILIPTYNEPDFILRRTIIGCQSLDYPNKTIYLLDDTKRPEIAKLAQSLGCRYLTRSDNLYAKAGNLNHAIYKTQGELIAVFDADFIPTSNFLTQTVGFFQNSQVGLVQTPQNFYNLDPISLNLGLDNVLPPEEEIFHRQIQLVKEANGGVICAGTSFVVRRKALAEIGYFVTDSLSEDYFTGIELSARGYQLIYLNEKLSAGLAAESITDHVEQRLRWGRGTLQAFFIKSNPLTIPGLTLRQRLAHLEGILHWFTALPRLLLIILPLPCLLLNLSPIITSTNDVIYIFLPYYFFQILVFSWLNLRSRSAVFSDIYDLISLFPVAINVIKVMLNPFGKDFKVTPKGLSRNKAYYNWQLAIPLIILLIINILSLVVYFTKPTNSLGLGLVVVWSIYNMVNLTVALLALLDQPQIDKEIWFPFKYQIKCTINQEQSLPGQLMKLSESGAEIILDQPLSVGDNLVVDIIEKNICLKALVSKSKKINSYFKIKVNFLEVSIPQQRQLIQMLFCRPGQWKNIQTPGELESLILFFKVILRFINKNLFRQKATVASHL